MDPQTVIAKRSSGWRYISLNFSMSAAISAIRASVAPPVLACSMWMRAHSVPKSSLLTANVISQSDAYTTPATTVTARPSRNAGPKSMRPPSSRSRRRRMATKTRLSAAAMISDAISRKATKVAAAAATKIAAMRLS